MATREEIGTADRAIIYLNNCQRDLRDNAQLYLDEIANAPRRRTTAQLGATVTADGQAISRLMVRLANFFSDPVRQTKGHERPRRLRNHFGAGQCRSVDDKKRGGCSGCG
jgi:hypothetical protein